MNRRRLILTTLGALAALPFAMYRGPTGPVVSIGSLIISSEAERDAFLQTVADMILKAGPRK